LFCIYLGLRVGDPLAHLHAHAAWRRQSASVRNIFASLGQLIELAVATPLFGAVALALLIWTCQGPLRAAFARLRSWILVEDREPQPQARARPRRSRERDQRRARGPKPAPDREEPAPAPAPGAPPPPIAWPDRAAGFLSLAVILVGLGLALPEGPIYAAVTELKPLTTRISLCLFLGLGVHAWWRRGPFWGCLVLVPVLQGLATGTYLSMNRIVLAAFPGFLDLAELLRPRLLFVVWLAAFAFAQAEMIEQFVNWQFLG
jgi:hypothetical protein